MVLSEQQINTAMGRVLARYRGELRLSQNKMGELLGVGQRTVSEIENGHRGMTAAEVVMFSITLSSALPYSRDEIEKEFISGRHLRLVEEADQPPSTDSEDTACCSQTLVDLGFFGRESELQTNKSQVAKLPAAA